MENREYNRKIIEETGKKYDDIIFEEDFIPKNVYLYQIHLRNKIINKTFANKKFSYLLDLGCGTGFHLSTLAQYADNLIGIDMSFGALKQCKKKTAGDFIVCDTRHMPFKDNTIDCIWTSGVLHHVPRDLENVISGNIARILRKGGIFLVDEPNKMNPLNYIILKISKADPTGEEKPLSVSQIGKLLKMNNLIILNSAYYEFFSPFGLVLKSENLTHFFRLFDSWLSTSFLRIFLLRWTIYARKE